MRVIVAILLVLLPLTARAATVNAASASRSDVNNAINFTAVDDDIVVVPAGVQTWSTTITVAKRITIQGAGIGQTKITDGTSGGGCFQFNLSASARIRLTGFEFFSSGSHTSDGIINLDGSQVVQSAFRIDHCRITISSAVTRGIVPNGVYGLIDHCTFWMTAASGSVQMITIYGSPDGNDAGFTPWTRALTLGTTNAVYVEDCSFTNANRVESINDAYGGARFVFRYNAITNGEFGSCHGTDSGNRRSAHSYEVYRNVYHNNCGVAIRAGTIRGGTGVFHDNIYTASGGGSSWGGVNLMYYRMTTTLDNSQWGRCDGTVWELGSANLSNNESRHCTTTGNIRFCSGDNATIGTEGAACSGGTYSTAFDGTGTSGYPGRDQPGFTTAMVSSPVYAWNQTNAGTLGTYDGGEPHVNGLGIETWMAEGRDYTNNLAKPGYTPLVYPHPLNTDGGGDITAPVVTITSQGGASSFDNGAVSSIAMSGTSSDDTGVTTVTWSNNRGGSGTATGTTSWSFTATGLSSGHNIITVDAADAAGNHGTDSLDVSYTPVSGSTYYVSTSGSDSADGSIGTPWKTLQTSIGKMVSGDTLYLRAGTFSDPDVPDINNFTAAGTPTRFLGYPGEKVILNGPGTNSGACGIFNSANVIWGDMTISNFNIALIVFGASHEIVLTNLTVWQIGQQGLYVYDSSYNASITNCLVRNTGAYPGRNGEGIYIGLGQPGGDPTHNVYTLGNVISNVTDEAIELKQGSYSNVVAGNIISHGAQQNVEGAIELDEDGNYNLDPGHIVEGNIIHDYGGWSFGIHGMTGCTIRNNVLYNRGSAVPIKLEETVADTWLRAVYNNTIDGGTITVVSTQSILTNNIGDTTTGNIAFNSAYFVDAANHDYRLVPGAAAVDTGQSLSSIFSVDLLGIIRPQGTGWDYGAYELAPGFKGGHLDRARAITGVP